MMRFIEWPLALLAVPVLVLLSVLALYTERRSRAIRLAKLGTSSMIAKLVPFGARLGRWRMLRITTALACCGLAFAGPRWGIARTFARSTGLDVVVVMDASLSMMANDVAPTRLDNAKDVVRQLRAASPNDRFALVAFAAHSYVLSPPTPDQSAFNMYLTNLDTATVGVRGSSMSDAIKQAATLLHGERGDSSRAIVVLSDGEDFEPAHDLVAQAKQVADSGIALITVGFGTERGSSIPIRTPRGGTTMMQDTTTGQMVVTHYVPFFLRTAALAGQGTFIPADSANKAVLIRQVLNTLKPETRTTQTGELFEPRFQWFLVSALLLLLLDTFILLRARKRVLVAATVAATLATAACEQTPGAHGGASAARSPRADYASMVMYNRGTELLRRDLQAAVPLLDSAAESTDSLVDFRAEFNSGWASLVSSLQLKHQLIGIKSGVAGDTALEVPSPGAVSESSVAAEDAGTVGQEQEAPQVMTGAQKALADSVNTLVVQMYKARSHYRFALLVNETRIHDAKWNYELALSPLEDRVSAGPESGGYSGGASGKSRERQQEKAQRRQKKPKSAEKPAAQAAAKTSTRATCRSRNRQRMRRRERCSK